MQPYCCQLTENYLLQRLFGVLASLFQHAHEDDKEDEEYDGQDGAHHPHHRGLLGVGPAGRVARGAPALVARLRPLGQRPRRLLHHVQGQLGREGAGCVEVFLWDVHVSPDENLVVDARLQLVVDEALVVLAVAQHKRVGDGPLKEFSRNVWQMIDLGLSASLPSGLAVGCQFRSVKLVREVDVGLVGVRDHHNIVVAEIFLAKKGK